MTKSHAKLLSMQRVNCLLEVILIITLNICLHGETRKKILLAKPPEKEVQYNLNGSNTDSSLTMDNSNLFSSP